VSWGEFIQCTLKNFRVSAFRKDALNFVRVGQVACMLPALPTAHFYLRVNLYLSLVNVAASFPSDIYVSFSPLPVLDVLFSIVR